MERHFSELVRVEEAAMPVINFDDINPMEGAYQTCKHFWIDKNIRL